MPGWAMLLLCSGFAWGEIKKKTTALSHDEKKNPTTTQEDGEVWGEGVFLKEFVFLWKMG